MLTVGGLKVGVLGISTTHTKTSTLPKNVAHLVFDDEVETARRLADKLRKDGADIVVALAHCGLIPSQARRRVAAAALKFTPADLAYVGDLKIARGAAVDIVFGGHMHTGLDKPWRDPQSGAWIVQSFENLIATSRVVVKYDTKARRIRSVDGRLVDLWVDEVGQDPGVAAVIKPYIEKVGASLDKVVGHAADDRLRRIGKLDNPLGSWVADVIRAKVEAEIGIQNSYGIRDNVFKGRVRLRDLYRVMPFENTVVLVTLRGAEIEELVRANLRGTKSKIQVSGLQVTYKLGADGRTIADLEVTVNGDPLRPALSYRVATNNYLAGGGSGGKILVGKPMRDTQIPIRDLLVAAFKAHSPIAAPAMGRIVLMR